MSAGNDFEGVGVAGVSDIATDSGCGRAGERVSVDEPGEAWQDAVSLWRVQSHRPSAARARARTRRTGRCCRGRRATGRRSSRGEALPANWGGGVNLWPWGDSAAREEHCDESRNWWGTLLWRLRTFNFAGAGPGASADLRAAFEEVGPRIARRGNDTMPNFVMLRLPNDHTAGTTPGGPTPKASVADNDLAVGRGGGDDLAYEVLGGYGVFLFLKTMRRMGAGPCGRASEYCAGGEQVLASRGGAVCR